MNMPMSPSFAVMVWTWLLAGVVSREVAQVRSGVLGLTALTVAGRRGLLLGVAPRTTATLVVPVRGAPTCHKLWTPVLVLGPSTIWLLPKLRLVVPHFTEVTLVLVTPIMT